MMGTRATFRRIPSVLFGFLVLTVGLKDSVRADLIYFKAGGRAQLPTRIEGDTFLVDAPDGVMAFHRDDIRKRVAGHWPAEEWESRRIRALEGGAKERFEAAWWALEHGLTTEVEAMLRDAHSVDPRHQPTGRMLAALEGLKTPCSEPPSEPLRQALGGRFEVARGRHVLLFHQHPAREALERVELVERVVTTFCLVMAAEGLELPVPRDRLVSVWFGRQADYLAFLHDEGADAFRTTTGYFHPTRNVVIAYDSRSSELQRTAREALAVRRRELDLARAQLPPRGRIRFGLAGVVPRTLDRASALAELDRLGREVDRQQLLLDLDRRTIDLGTAAHETVHQLVACSGLAPRHSDFPLWLHEGFAAQFEVIRGGRWAGIGRAHETRLPEWRRIATAPRLAQLLRDEGFGRGYQPAAYAQAWALVYFLRKEHAAQFPTFLDLLRAPGSDVRPHPERIMSAFQAAFGHDLNALESEWHRFMNALHTPLEREEVRPEGDSPSKTSRN
jgi:hypothetical protein